MASELEKVVAEMREAVGCGRTIGQGGQCERRDYACGECAKLQAWADRLAALEGGWRPIEEAPRDGTRVTLLWAGKIVRGYYLDNRHTSRPWAGWKLPSLEPVLPGQPTHYLPDESLPAPPEGAKP